MVLVGTRGGDCGWAGLGRGVGLGWAGAGTGDGRGRDWDGRGRGLGIRVGAGLGRAGAGGWGHPTGLIHDGPHTRRLRGVPGPPHHGLRAAAEAVELDAC